jgi:PIN domain nuclease of toxin-antitoxin system
LIRLIADTHALVWYLRAKHRLGRAARRALARAETGRALVLVPAIVLAEIGLLYERERIDIATADVVRALLGQPGFAVLALDAEQAVEFSSLRGVRDPIDRLILAAARVAEARLVSADEAQDGFGVERVWD